ncbi:MAG: hypothetical protein BMS9Abin07_1120 [Acidimicrobiia bacterium]|nr:MAG: hypothetical protein BMS9Abin07_1120 [Acidimicrobiia bacterium]
MSTRPAAERYPTVRQGYDPTLVESDFAALQRAHQTVVDDAATKIAVLEQALALANNRTGPDAGHPSDEIIADARKEAFNLITEARKEAGAVVAEALSEVERAEQPAAPGVTDALQAEELRLEARIVELQATLTGLEIGIRSLAGLVEEQQAAAGAAPPPASAPPTIEYAPTPTHIELQPPPLNDPTENGGAALREPLLPPQRKQSPPPPPPPPEPEPAAAVLVDDLTVEVDDSPVQAPAPDGGRPSFYSRRSAQLPHIGAEAGHSAIAAATELRATMNGKGA